MGAGEAIVVCHNDESRNCLLSCVEIRLHKFGEMNLNLVNRPVLNYGDTRIGKRLPMGFNEIGQRNEILSDVLYSKCCFVHDDCDWSRRDMPAVKNGYLYPVVLEIIHGETQSQISPLGNMQGFFRGLAGALGSIGLHDGLSSYDLCLFGLLVHPVSQILCSFRLDFHGRREVLSPSCLIPCGDGQTMCIRSAAAHFHPLEANENSSNARQNYGRSGPSQSGSFKASHLLFYVFELLCGGYLLWVGTFWLGYTGRRGLRGGLMVLGGFGLTLHAGVLLLLEISYQGGRIVFLSCLLKLIVRECRDFL